jgi:hypothetical protein
VGKNAFAEAGTNPTDSGNLAVNIGNDNAVSADGTLNNAFDIGGTQNQVVAAGVANNATNLSGSGNFVGSSAGTSLTRPGLSSAFNVGGSGNDIIAGNFVDPSSGGPFAIAGAIGVSGKNIFQQNTGSNVHTPLNP